MKIDTAFDDDEAKAGAGDARHVGGAVEEREKSDVIGLRDANAFVGNAEDGISSLSPANGKCPFPPRERMDKAERKLIWSVVQSARS